MKKFVKVMGIVLISFLAIMCILPFAFKGKVKEMVITEGNKMLNAEFGFEDVSINLLREFPKASIGLEGFWLRGVNAFENDTLAAVSELRVSVDIMSLFGEEGFNISKILLAKTQLNAIILENGEVNWDIVKSDSLAPVEEEDSTSTSNFRIVLNELSVEDLNITFTDHQNQIYASVSELNAICSGDMSAENTLLDLKSSIHALTLKMGDIPYLSQASITADLNIDADLKNGKFTLKENTIALNAIQATFDGWVSIPENSPMSMDIQLNSSSIKFKEILSLIPAIYTKDFEDLKADGNVSLSAYAKGELSGDTLLPKFEMVLNVTDGSFRYPALPAGVDDIQIIASVSNPGGMADLTTINVEDFRFNMLGNVFKAKIGILTPISDPEVSLSANGTIDLGQIKNIYPLEDITLNGLIDANMDFSGRLSYIDKEEYDRFKANGFIKLKNMILRMKEIPDVSILKSTFTFTPKSLRLSETTVNIGKNDITTDCLFENYMAFALKGKTLKGQLNVQSKFFNLNDFMTADSDTIVATIDTTTTTSETTGTIVIPKNIDFNMNVNMQEILFDKITIANLNGKLIVNNGTADMKNLSMNVMGGKIIMNGAYSTEKSEKQPELNASFNMSDISFAQAFKELNMIQKMAPIFENLKGSFSGKMNIETQLDSVMSPIFQSLTGSGSLSTSNLNLSNVEILNKIADATKYDALRDINVKNMKVDFVIDKGRLNTKPFDINMGKINLNLSGSTGLDQTIDYTGKLKLPQTGSLASLTTIDLKINGTFTDPQITIDTKSMVKQATSVVAEKAANVIGEKLGVDLSNAEKQKEALVSAATAAAEKLLSEAQKQSDNLVSKAGNNVLKKLAAQKAGDAIVSEAKKQGEKLIKEATEKGDALIEKARNE